MIGLDATRKDSRRSGLRHGAPRWLLGLAFFRDLSHAQIAAQTGLPLGTVKSVLLRAQTQLREQLAGQIG